MASVADIGPNGTIVAVRLSIPPSTRAVADVYRRPHRSMVKTRSTSAGNSAAHANEKVRKRFRPRESILRAWASNDCK